MPPSTPLTIALRVAVNGSSVQSDYFHPTPDDGVRVAWVCENNHVYYGGEKFLTEDLGLTELEH